MRDEYRPISPNIACKIAQYRPISHEYRIDAFSGQIWSNSWIDTHTVSYRIYPNKRRGRLFTQQPLMGGRLFNFLQKS